MFHIKQNLQYRIEPADDETVSCVKVRAYIKHIPFDFTVI